MTLPPFWLFLYASFYDGIGHFERRQTCNCKKKNHLFSNLFFLSQSLLFFFLLGLPQRETKLKIALRFFFFFFFFRFHHSVTNRRLGLKNACAGNLVAAWVCMGRPFFSRRFSRFPKENTTFPNGTSKEELLRNTQQFR